MIVHFSKSMKLDDIKNEIESNFENAGIYECYYFKIGHQWFRYSFGIDEDAESPRVWDNAGTMVCWHRRYTLGDEQPKNSPEEYLGELLVESFKALDKKQQDIAVKHLVAMSISQKLVKEEKDGRLSLNTEYSDFAETFEGEFGLKFVDSVRYSMQAFQLAYALNDIEELGIVILPLYLMDHSGISMRTYSYNDPWDSGQVGFIYACKNEYEEFVGQKLGEDWKDIIQHELMDEVETYSQYMQNEVYFYSFSKYVGDNAVTESNIESQTAFSVEDSCGGFYGDDIAKNGILTELAGDVEYLLEKTQAEEIDRDAFVEYVDWLYKTDEFKDALQDKVLPKMLAGILDYASGLSPDAQKEFLKQCLPDVGENIIHKVYIN